MHPTPNASVPRRRNSQPVVYTLVGLALIGSVYNRLDFVAHGDILALRLQHVLDAWPALLTLLSAVLFLFGAALSTWRPRRAAKVALLAALLACPDLMFSLLIYSLLIFLAPKGIIFLGIPIALVLTATLLSLRVLKSGR